MSLRGVGVCAHGELLAGCHRLLSFFKKWGLCRAPAAQGRTLLEVLLLVACYEVSLAFPRLAAGARRTTTMKLTSCCTTSGLDKLAQYATDGAKY